MSKDAKLQAVLTTCELEEQQAIERKQKVDQIVEQRAQAVNTLKARRDTVALRLRDLIERRRPAALVSGKASDASSIQRYARRLGEDLACLDKEIQERGKELARAVERATLAGQALVQARVEKRKIEKVLENRHHSARVFDAATEEEVVDEFNVFRRESGRK